ncbi:MAG TPA: hypothetical protein VFR94_16075 [Nitrososphaeraceae archaeon]|nr:hypothetical protein [Nitrososphaeraceae archaeon]
MSKLIYSKKERRKESVVETSRVLFYIAAATTMIAGVLHLAMIGPSLKPINFPMELLPYTDGLFFMSGITQIFWALPMALRWNIRWFYAGLIGTITLTSLIALTRIPNEITGVALQDKNPMALLTEVMQTTYIVTTLTIILNKKRMMFGESEMIIIR